MCWWWYDAITGHAEHFERSVHERPSAVAEHETGTRAGSPFMLIRQAWASFSPRFRWRQSAEVGCVDHRLGCYDGGSTPSRRLDTAAKLERALRTYSGILAALGSSRASVVSNAIAPAQSAYASAARPARSARPDVSGCVYAYSPADGSHHRCRPRVRRRAQTGTGRPCTPRARNRQSPRCVAGPTRYFRRTPCARDCKLARLIGRHTSCRSSRLITCIARR